MKFNRCFKVRDTNSSYNLFWKFRVIPPATLTDGQHPLIIALHGAAGGSDVAHMNTECYIEPGFSDLNAFIISPNAGTAEWYELVNQEKLFNLIQLAFEYWPVDRSKLVVVGYSNGGNAS